MDLVARLSIVQRERVARSAAGVVAGREAARAAKMVADLNAEELERACGCDDLLVKCAVYPLLCPVLARLTVKGYRNRVASELFLPPPAFPALDALAISGLGFTAFANAAATSGASSGIGAIPEECDTVW